MRVLGIDYGEKNIGLATGESETRISLARAPLKRQSDEQLVAELQRVVRDEEITNLVVGWPRSLRGTDESAARRVRAFSDKLAVATRLPVYFMDERLSTQAAQRLKKNNSRASIDSLSAQIILQTYLDSLEEK